MPVPASMPSPAELAQHLGALPARHESYATQFVDRLLEAAVARLVSDIHLNPGRDGLQVVWRANGVLEPIGTFSPGESTDVVSRLKVMANLLTYRSELPQEGRLQRSPASLEMRISTFPTLHGERAVIRIFRRTAELERLCHLGLPDDLMRTLAGKLQQTQGAIIITGPAGSGKTTTAYACLREVLAQEPPRSIVSLEDPIESEVSGVAQSAMQPAAGFDFAIALRSVMRQDPEVILVGEVRDRETAAAAFQAALTGHLVLTTFHAGSAAAAISRLNDMGIEPYLVRSGVQTIIGQRLLRRLCPCASEAPADDLTLGEPVTGARTPRGCLACAQAGYSGRMVLAEALPPLEGELGRLVLERADAPRLEAAAKAAGLVSLWQRALTAVGGGLTSAAEVHRVLGTVQ